MNFRQWLQRSLIFHRRLHMAHVALVALTTAILAGALLCGEALNRDLARIARERTGKIKGAIDLGDRLARATLADRLQQSSGGVVAPVLRLNGELVQREDGADTGVISGVQVLGSDQRLARLFDASDAGAELLLSRRLAATAGWEFTRQATTSRIFLHEDSRPALRFMKPSFYPSEMPLADRREGGMVRQVLPTLAVLSDAHLGRFSLVASQIPPLNAVIPLSWLTDKLETTAVANLFVSDLDPERLRTVLQQNWQPADMGIEVGAPSNGCRLVQAESLFLNEAVCDALTRLQPSPVLSLHHLADGFAALKDGIIKKEVPYGFVAALTPTGDPRLGVVPCDMRDDEVRINAWLAEKLDLKVGEILRLQWRRFEADGQLVSDSADLRVAGIISMEDAVVERARLPVFPGLSDVDRCADWDIGMPMDEAKLADKDNEKYWQDYGATPKVFVTYNAGCKIFGTVFGVATGARLSETIDDEMLLKDWQQIEPASAGFVVRDIVKEAQAAVSGAMDFKQLFVGMAIVLLVSALLLLGLVAGLIVDQRQVEIGSLRICGMGVAMLQRLLLAEAGVTTAIGSGLGALGGWFFARILVWGINRHWNAITPGMQIEFDTSVWIWFLAVVVAVLLTMGTVWVIIRRVCKQPAQQLLMGMGLAEEAGWLRSKRVVRILVFIVCVLIMALVMLWYVAHGNPGLLNGGLFFGAGALLLAAFLLSGYAMARATPLAVKPRNGIWRLGVASINRRAGRNLLLAALLAIGIFLSVGVLSMQHRPDMESLEPKSPGGGFTWMLTAGEAIPADRRDSFMLKLQEVVTNVAALRLHDGAEASCNNLNRTAQPRVLGLDIDEIFRDGAFGFGDKERELLRVRCDDGCIPALAGDLTTVQYGLAARADPHEGTVFTYETANKGSQRVRLVGSLPLRTTTLQGGLLIDARYFTRMFPLSAGYRMWLVSRKQGNDEGAIRQLRRLFQGRGVDIVRSSDRLAELNELENSYLRMFLVLGGLGVILGTAGMGLVVLRHVIERRQELALLRAVGWSRLQVTIYLIAEHSGVLLYGLLSGTVAALLAIAPLVSATDQKLPLGTLGILLLAMVVSGLGWTLWAALRSTRGALLSALHNE